MHIVKRCSPAISNIVKLQSNRENIDLDNLSSDNENPLEDASDFYIYGTDE